MRRFSPRVLVALFLLLVGEPALAATTSLEALRSEDGWIAVAEEAGVVVELKDIPGHPVQAVRGTRTLPGRTEADYRRLITVIADRNQHARVVTALAESATLGPATQAGCTDFYQVAKAPFLFVPARFWVNQGCAATSPASFEQSWSNLGCEAHPEVCTRILEADPDAVEVRQNDGYWQVTLDADGTLRARFATVSNPGGNLKSGPGLLLVNWLTRKQLPTTINAFFAAADVE